jgi:sugar transferase (PEP-CTERM/EpsH1 system associated)
MNILWLNAGLLLPLDKGGKLRTWHLMRHLAARHRITWLSYADPDQPAADVQGMSAVAERVHTLPRRLVSKGSVRFILQAAAHLVNPLPYAVGAYTCREYRRRLMALLAEQHFDVIVCDFLMPSANVPDDVSSPTVLFTHNVEAEIWRRHYETASRAPKRHLMKQQWRRMLRYERRAVQRFDLVLAVSDTDRDTLERLYAPLKGPVKVVPTGVDTSYFAPVMEESRPTHMVFTGSMDWLPNEDGMLFFVREVLPLIRQREPGATLSIVGRAPTAAVSRLANEPGVEVTGRVDDVRPHIGRGAVYIVPLRIGGGTRLKIFEAMAMGRAVVSTTIGAEGLPVRDGTHLRIADDPRAFADAVVRLFEDDAERRALGQRARQLVVEQYDWAAAAAELEDALLEAARRGRLGAPMESELTAAVGEASYGRAQGFAKRALQESFEGRK